MSGDTQSSEISPIASHSVDVRDKLSFLHRMMNELAGDAGISLEGDLSHARVPESLVVASDETPILKRHTAQPRQDFVVLQLTPETVAPIFRELKAAGLKRAIIYVQIERHGVLELGAYDNLHPECVVTGPGISSLLLAELKNAKTVRDFRPLVVRS